MFFFACVYANKRISLICLILNSLSSEYFTFFSKLNYQNTYNNRMQKFSLIYKNYRYVHEKINKTFWFSCQKKFETKKIVFLLDLVIECF